VTEIYTNRIIQTFTIDLSHIFNSVTYIEILLS